MRNAIGSRDDDPGGAADGGGGVSMIGAVAAVVRSAASMLAEFLDRIVHGIRCLPLVLGLGGAGCQSTSETVDVAPAVEPVPGATVPKAEDSGPRQLGQFTITFYYVVGEDEVAPKSRLLAANDNRGSGGGVGGVGGVESDAELAAIAPDLVTLYAGSSKCEPIAEVSKEFATQLAVQGTGKLHDGRVLNIWGPCNCKRSPCFQVTRAQWGTAGTGKPLQPFRTVAVDPKVVKLGSLLYVPLLEGRTMPGRQPWGGYVHDGCVIADDTGGHISGNRIDLFVGRKAYFVSLGPGSSGGSHAWARHVPIYDGSGICERKGRQITRKTGAI
jgi:3D (Asp-Asp-Asp) domain-containing protein